MASPASLHFQAKPQTEQPTLKRAGLREIAPQSWFQYHRIPYFLDNTRLNRNDIVDLSKNDERDIRIYIPSIMGKLNQPALRRLLSTQATSLANGSQKDITLLLLSSRPWKTTLFLEKSEDGQLSLIHNFALEGWSLQNIRIPFVMAEDGAIVAPQESLTARASNRAQFYPAEKDADKSTAYVEVYLQKVPGTEGSPGEVAQIGQCDIKKALNESSRMVYELAGHLQSYLDSANRGRPVRS